MSDENTADLAELNRLEWELGAAARTKSVQLVNSGFMPGLPVGAVAGDPNHTADSHPHLDVVREKLRAGAKDEKAAPEDRAAAIEALRVMYRETV
jgi:hypothetical protein